MTYSSGGLIQAADYNNLNGGSPANVSGQLNTVWAVGNGNRGLGQTAIANVSSGIVTATNWATFINTLNTIRASQSTSWSNLSAPTAGSRINFLSTLQSGLTDAYNNTGNGNAINTGNSTLVSASKTCAINAAANTAGVDSKLFTITFSSVDAARYFFNAGGFITVTYAGFTNTGGTARGTSLETLAVNYSQKNLYSNSFSARYGTGGTATVDVTTSATGYYALPSTLSTNIVCNIVSTSYYSGDFIRLEANTAGGAGSYGANGNIIYLFVTLYSGTTNAYNAAVNASVDFFCGVYESVRIPRTWGTPTIA